MHRPWHALLAAWLLAGVRLRNIALATVRGAVPGSIHLAADFRRCRIWLFKKSLPRGAYCLVCGSATSKLTSAIESTYWCKSATEYL